jgi:hypothetical protein
VVLWLTNLSFTVAVKSKSKNFMVQAAAFGKFAEVFGKSGYFSGAPPKVALIQ